MAARQAAAETKRGGGERGSTERGKSSAIADSIGEIIAAGAATATGWGSTKAIEVVSERSESWQQDMEQAIIPDMSWPQSMRFEGAA
jgi:hypothetical protein